LSKNNNTINYKWRKKIGKVQSFLIGVPRRARVARNGNFWIGLRVSLLGVTPAPATRKLKYHNREDCIEINWDETIIYIYISGMSFFFSNLVKFLPTPKSLQIFSFFPIKKKEKKKMGILWNLTLLC
jgi:hypothetical protein